MQVFSSGSKTIDAKNPVDANTRFEIGSTTKSFSASIVLSSCRIPSVFRPPKNFRYDFQLCNRSPRFPAVIVEPLNRSGTTRNSGAKIQYNVRSKTRRSTGIRFTLRQRVRTGSTLTLSFSKSLFPAWTWKNFGMSVLSIEYIEGRMDVLFDFLSLRSLFSTFLLTNVLRSYMTIFQLDSN
jgi:hypothetical protein